MNSILVVDDEAIIRQGIVSRIEYLKLMPEAIYQASNGIEALEIVREHHPAIVMTDIRMPKMNGLELARVLQAEFPDIAIIILTVYNEFDYAKEALTLGVSDYLLKPISNGALIETLQIVDDKINEKLRIVSALSSATKLQEENDKLSSEQMFHKLLGSGTLTEKEKATHSLLFGSRHHSFSMALAGYEAASADKRRDYSSAHVGHSLFTIAQSISSPLGFHIFESYGTSHQFYVIISAQNAETLSEQLTFFLGSLMFKAQEKLNIILTLGVSEPAEYVCRKLLSQSSESYNQRLISGNGNFFLYDQPKDIKIHPRLENELAQMTKCIGEGNTKRALEVITSMLGEAGSSLKFVWTQIINHIIRSQSHKWSQLPPSIKSSLLYALSGDVFDMFHSRDEMVKHIQSLINSILGANEIGELDSAGRICMAIDYINSNYTKDILLNDLAERFEFSPNYLSTAFKKETGKNFVGYITELRIKEACRLLAETDVRVVDVSYKVGYDDSQYFFRVFKKQTGKTPLQYRNECNKN